MESARQKVFAIWDQSTPEVQTLCEKLVRRPPEGILLSFASLAAKTPDLLEETVLPGIQSADRVLVIQPSDADVVPVAFQMGLAIGLGKPLAILDQLSAPALYLSYSTRLLFGSDIPEEAITSDRDRIREKLSRADFGYVVPLPEAQTDEAPLFLCPPEGMGSELRTRVEAVRPGWRGPEPNESARLAAGASQLLWIVPPAPLLGQWGNVLSALAAGVFYARQTESVPHLEILRHREAPMLPLLARYCRTFSTPDEIEELLRPHEARPFLRVETLEIRNFKNLRHLKLDFRAKPSSSDFSGDWTCIAGINGSGKSSILQALALVLLGERLTPEVGGDWLRRMVRDTGEHRLPAEITTTVGDGEETQELRLRLSEEGVDDVWSVPQAAERLQMKDTWERLHQQVLVSYGASRNLSDDRDDRHKGKRSLVRRQMTLFDSRAQISRVEVLLAGGLSSAAPLRTLNRLLRSVLAEETSPSLRQDLLRFGQSGVRVEAIDLPDGFRSTVAWLADLCAVWHEVAPEEAASSDPSRMQGIVLLDEVDLHLHPTLQRELIPRLRKALPNVQFFVTTHSPLVLASFDRSELVVLDRDEEGGIRELDRQIFGFSADQIYQWLMETPPHSVVIEEMVEKGDDPDLPLYLLQSGELDEEKARDEMAERRRLIEELLDAP